MLPLWVFLLLLFLCLTCIQEKNINIWFYSSLSAWVARLFSFLGASREKILLLQCSFEVVMLYLWLEVQGNAFMVVEMPITYILLLFVAMVVNIVQIFSVEDPVVCFWFYFSWYSLTINNTVYFEYCQTWPFDRSWRQIKPNRLIICEWRFCRDLLTTVSSFLNMA